MDDKSNDNQNNPEIRYKMLEALSGNFTRRNDEVTGRSVLLTYRKERPYSEETRTASKFSWSTLYAPDEEGDLRTKISFDPYSKTQGGILEAFVLIPEEQGLVELDRVAGSYYNELGFLHPNYQEEGVKLIQDVASQHFEECGDIFQKRYLIDIVRTLIPKDLKIFREEYRERMLQGLKNTEFNNDSEIEVLWANVTDGLCKLGFNSHESDFVSAIWDKSKTIPYGYLEGLYGAQTVLAGALLDRDAKGLMEFDYIRNSLHYANLSSILSTLPVRNTDVQMRRWQLVRGYPNKKVYEPIVNFMDGVLSK